MKKFLLALFLFTGCMVCYAGGMQRDISNQMTRLHILANSDSVYDQEIKIKVRDNVLSTVEIDEDNIETQLPMVESQVNDYLKNLGVEYKAKAEYGYSYFPTKEYENISLPAGKYRAVRILLGNAEGHNWWCVMFPPLCFADGSVGYIDKEAEKYLRSSLTEDEYNLISLNNDVKIKFKIIELLNSKNNK